MKNKIKKCLSSVIYAVAILSIAGCEKRNDQAVVILKEHIPVREAGYTPSGEKAASPNKPAINEEKGTDLGEGTITVDGYIMRPEVQGTGRDPRALNHEQWIITVRLTESGRVIRVQTDRAQFEKFNNADLVRVKYRVGKYTGTVWRAEIVEQK